MLPGVDLIHDKDFDYAIDLKRDVEVRVEGEVDYVGKVLCYNRDVFQVVNGDYYLRGIVEVKTKA
jgi:hypothetical protein